MDYQQRNPLTDAEKEFYVNLVQLCPPGMVVFSKIKLAEIVKPTAESGTDKFYDDVKKILSYTLDFVVYDLNRNYSVAVFDYQETSEIKQDRKLFLTDVFNHLKIRFYSINRLADLYLTDFLEV
ncbi:TPA: DUF2726 domain-containing protein [Serratia marcescens]|uniref:DUF2726 domain-containing protein n=1 Tax=Serratia ureilytica TaxID=300181 RepID=UPI0018D5CD9E|nr:DUF2726 domain-containing protein [Serratia ureilytica]MBH3020002.1 DUF2726 domain-containing protein [Serratia ureilytica]